jgi:hypothetical protein
MCTLRDLDVQSRAAVSLVEEWQREHATVRFIWKLQDIIGLLLEALSGSLEVRECVAAGDGGEVADSHEREKLIPRIAYFLDTLKRLQAATESVLGIVSMFESEGYPVESADKLREKRAAIPEIIREVDAFREELEWMDLEKTALPSATIRAVADYLASTGQASA